MSSRFGLYKHKLSDNSDALSINILSIELRGYGRKAMWYYYNIGSSSTTSKNHAEHTLFISAGTI